MVHYIDRQIVIIIAEPEPCARATGQTCSISLALLRIFPSSNVRETLFFINQLSILKSRAFLQAKLCANDRIWSVSKTKQQILSELFGLMFWLMFIWWSNLVFYWLWNRTLKVGWHFVTSSDQFGSVSRFPKHKCARTIKFVQFRSNYLVWCFWLMFMFMLKFSFLLTLNSKSQGWLAFPDFNACRSTPCMKFWPWQIHFQNRPSGDGSLHRSSNSDHHRWAWALRARDWSDLLNQLSTASHFPKLKCARNTFFH